MKQLGGIQLRFQGLEFVLFALFVLVVVIVGTPGARVGVGIVGGSGKLYDF